MTDEATQGVILTNAVLESFKDGAFRTFLYELQDDTSSTPQGNQFGLFRIDGSAKPAANAIGNLLRLLSDPANSVSKPLGSLAYSIAGLPGTASSMLLQKSPSPATDTLVLRLSEDAWQSNAQCTISVDGKSLGLAQTVTASHGKGAVQNFAFAQAMTAGVHDVAVSFLNDAYGGSAASDRNLYVQGITANGTALPGTAATILGTATQHFSVVIKAPS